MEFTPKSREEILEALHTIQQVCIEHDYCCKCPFFIETEDVGCSTMRTDPASWRIANKDGPWKAFKD